MIGNVPYSEAAYFDGYAVAHIADWQDMQRVREIRNTARNLIRSERRLYRTAIQLRNEAREIREGCERALEKFSA